MFVSILLWFVFGLGMGGRPMWIDYMKLIGLIYSHWLNC